MKHAPLLALTAIAALFLSGCTDSGATPDSTSNGSEPADHLAPITVGVIPIADAAALYVGVEQGFFEEEGLDVTIETASGGAVIIPSVSTGDYDFGFSNMLSILVAAEQGLEVSIVAPAVVTTGDTSSDVGAIIVKEDSDIRSVADLAGRSVSSNTLGNINETVTRAVIDAGGGDSSATEFVEIPFPDAIAAIENDQVDAAFVVEPFVTTAIDSGNRVVSYAYAEFGTAVLAAYFSRSDIDPELSEKFRAAITKATEFSETNPDVVREVMASYTTTPPETLERITLPTYTTELSPSVIEPLSDAAQTYGALTTAPDFDALLP